LRIHNAKPKYGAFWFGYFIGGDPPQIKNWGGETAVASIQRGKEEIQGGRSPQRILTKAPEKGGRPRKVRDNSTATDCPMRKQNLLELGGVGKNELQRDSSETASY